MLFKYKNLITLLEEHTQSQPEKIIFNYLNRGEILDKSYSYLTLRNKAINIAGKLQYYQLENKRIILLIKDTLDFIEVFLACLYCKAIPIPVSVPNPNRSLNNLKSIIENSQSNAIVSGEKEKLCLRESLASLSLPNIWLTTETNHSEIYHYKKSVINENDLAFIQYTSGSTGQPKGVMVTHKNLMANEKIIQKAMHLHKNSVIINWLPTYHDMGLIGNILQPLYLGASCVTMLPTAFIQKPYRWLKAISDYHGTVTGAPNFAYDACVDRITEEQKSQLDLSSLEVMFTGSEPVRAKTIKRFSNYFNDCSFRKEAFFPCYGMAESTLFISGYEKTQEPKTCLVDKELLSNNILYFLNENNANAISIVSCGITDKTVDVVIVNPETNEPLKSNEIGEIWIKSDSIASGYFANQKATQNTFNHSIKGKTGTYLSTGDLGFLHDNELFISGRCKDLIIVRGKNFYPNDIEQTSAQTHELLINDGVAAFSIDIQGQEALIIVQEVEKEVFKMNITETIISQIKQTVIENHDVRASFVVLIKRGQLPRTTSGKVKRLECKNKYQNGFFQTMQFNAQMEKNKVLTNKGSSHGNKIYS